MTDPARPPSDRARLRRAPGKARYDRAALNAVLDATPLCHIAVQRDRAPAVIPTLQWRMGDHLYFHGSAASRFIRAASRAEICATVTLLDGLVMARSAFHHSVNHRSAVIYGQAETVGTPQDKAAALEAMFGRWFPGRWRSLRPMSAQELKATAVLRLGLEEASVKIRSGPPGDDEADYARDVWAGVIPAATALGAPRTDPRCALTPPDHLEDVVLALDDSGVQRRSA